MALPGFTNSGDLPVGVHAVSLSVTITRFGSGSSVRRRLAARLIRIHQIASQTGFLARFVVFGSFVSETRNPHDVDIFIIMEDNFDVRLLSGEARMMFDHTEAQNHFGCSVFWIRRMAAIGGEQAAIEDWQIKRDGTKRRIVEIVG